MVQLVLFFIYFSFSFNRYFFALFTFFSCFMEKYFKLLKKKKVPGSVYMNFKEKDFFLSCNGVQHTISVCLVIFF